MVRGGRAIGHPGGRPVFWKPYSFLSLLFVLPAEGIDRPDCRWLQASALKVEIQNVFHRNLSVERLPESARDARKVALEKNV